MLVSRLAGLVLPLSSKYLIDDVIGQRAGRAAADAGVGRRAATVVQAVTSFGLSQILGVAAQKAITDMRRRVEEHVMRLPVRYFDSTQTGVLISRVMNDAEGIRNLVGTGLVQLTGSVVTAIFALGFLLYLNWHLTLVDDRSCSPSSAARWATRSRRCGRCSASAARFTAEVTGRLNQALGGVRVVKTYTAERREDLVFTKGAHSAVPQHRQVDDRRLRRRTAFSSVVIGAIGIVMIVVGGHAIVTGTMTLGDLFSYIFFTGLMAMPIVQIASIGTQITEAFAGLDRIREILDTPREDADDADARGARRRCAATSSSSTCGSSTTPACRC